MNRANPVPAWIRYLLPMLLLIFLWLFMYVNSLFREPPGFAWYGLVWLFVTLYLVWGLAGWINKKLDQRYSWAHQIRQRLLVQVLLLTVLGTVIFLITFIIMNWFENEFYHLNNPIGWPHFVVVSVMGVLLTSLINAFQIGYQLSYYWNTAKLEAEQFKKESAEAQVQSLKSQIDPHFLFNNFNTLHGLIYEDQSKAGNYLLKLSDVYRQVLSTTNHQRITLREELKLVKPFIDLLKIRYGSNLVIQEHTSVDLDEWHLPPMAIQSLVENAIKHNSIDKARPLEIELKIDEGRCSVSNNKQLRSSTTGSNKLGLKNLSARSRYLTGVDIEVIEDVDHFMVIVPIIKVAHESVDH